MVEPRWLKSGLRGVGVFIVGVVFAAGCLLHVARAQSADADGGTGPENCLRCHAEKLKGYEHSAHGEAKVSCVKCHTVHAAGVKPGSEGQMLKVAEPKLCYGCHGEVEPEFQKAFHHNVDDGKIKCSDCHDLHAATEKKSLKRAANEAQNCLKCHKDLAGPFEFDHAPLKAEGCTICHMAHGGENPKLLRRKTVNELCGECHAPAVNIKGKVIQGHILNVKSAACTSCHVDIHGSHLSEAFFNTGQ